MNIQIVKELADGIQIIVRESTDSRQFVIELTSKKPMNEELFLGCLLQFLEGEAVELVTTPTDGFHCH